MGVLGSYHRIRIERPFLLHIFHRLNPRNRFRVTTKIGGEKGVAVYIYIYYKYWKIYFGFWCELVMYKKREIILTVQSVVKIYIYIYIITLD